jgi:hypothetical protein
MSGGEKREESVRVQSF